MPIPPSTTPHSARPRPRPLPRHLPPPFPLRTLRTQALTAPDGSYVLRVRLPGVSSAASVAADVVNDRAVEITASPADGGGAYRLLHALPFRLPAEGRDVPPPAARSVKFSRKAGGVLTVTFDPPARAAAPTTEGGGESPPSSRPPSSRPPLLSAPRVFPGLEAFENHPSLVLAEDAERGRHVRARRAIEPGELLIACEPFVATVHDRHAESTCARCFSSLAAGTVASPSRCDACGTSYCSRACLERDATHAGECALVSRARADPALRGAARGLRLFLRALFARAATPREWARADAALRGFPRGDDQSLDPSLMGMARAVNGLLPPENRVEPVEALAAFVDKTRANLHGVADAEGRNLGSGLFLEASVFNHACAPEAVASFDSRTRTMAIRAVRRVEEGGEVRIAYAEMYAPRRERRRALTKKKGFACRCERCEADDASDAALDGFRCDDPKCEGVVTRASWTDLDPSKCSSCGRASRRFASVAEADAFVDSVRSDVASALAALAAGDAASAIRVAAASLARSRSALSDRHAARHELKLALLDASTRAGRWEDAAALAADVANGWAAVCGEWHPGFAKAKAALGEALERVGRGRDAARAFDEAAGCLGVSYGEAHDATQRLKARAASARRRTGDAEEGP